MNWNIKLQPDGTVEIWSHFEEGGPTIYCRPSGEIALSEIPQYGGMERPESLYNSLGEAMKAAELFT